MNSLNYLNTLATIGTFGCVSFALSGLGVKLGKLSSDGHQLGFKYISTSDHKDKLYEAVAKANKENNSGAPKWAQEAETLKDWCEKNQKSTRYREDATRYCTISNTIRHQLIAHGLTIKENGEGEECKADFLDSYSDDSESSANYLFAKSRCTKENETTTVANSEAAA